MASSTAICAQAASSTKPCVTNPPSCAPRAHKGPTSNVRAGVPCRVVWEGA